MEATKYGPVEQGKDRDKAKPVSKDGGPGALGAVFVLAILGAVFWIGLILALIRLLW